MKRYQLLTLLTTAMLCACATHLSKQDNDRIIQIQKTAEDAKIQSQQALNDAALAQKAADKAATKADRIFKASQNK